MADFRRNIIEKEEWKMCKKKMTLMFLFSLVVIASLTLSRAWAYDIRWGTAPAGGVWQALGTAMLNDAKKSNPKIQGSTLPLGGAANVVAINTGKLTTCFSFSTMAAEAWEGKEFFKKHGKMQNVRGLAVLFPEPTQFVVWADSGIDSVTQLKGKAMTPGPKGSAIAPVTRYILESYGLSFKDYKTRYMSFREAGQQMIDGHIDAILYGAMAYPAPPIIAASSKRQIKLLDLSDAVIDNVVKKHKGLDPYTLAKGSYRGVDYPVKGIVAYVVVLCSRDMPDDIAYGIAKSISDNFHNYTKVTKAIALGKREEMGKPFGIPMHPGATKYYKEMGWAK
jgi:TRAP transporter TAXI family solute receptor